MAIAAHTREGRRVSRASGVVSGRRRTARAVLWFVALGLATTVAVSWLAAAALPVSMYPRRIVRVWVDDAGRAFTSAEVRTGAVHDVWWNGVESPPGTDDIAAAAELRATLDALVADRRGTEMRMRRGAGAPPFGTHRGGRAAESGAFGSDTAFGFPLPCLWYGVRSDVLGNTLVNERLVGGIPLAGAPSARGRDFRALPLLPAWPRLGANVALWGACWWAVLTLLGVLRRRRRRLGGACVRCGYSLVGVAATGGGAAVCPECGSLQTAPSA